MTIHPTAIVSRHAELGSDVEVGPHAVIEDGVIVGAGCAIMARAHLCPGAVLGPGCQIHMNAVIGHTPQDFSYKGEPLKTILGANVTARENVTIHGTKNEGGTRVGDNCYFMAGSHVAHDCVLGNNVTLVNGALLAGYVKIDDGAIVSAYVQLHQFVHVGRHAILAGGALVGMDVPPYMVAVGINSISTLNAVGLRRSKTLSDEDRREIKAAYKVLYRSELSLPQALEKLKAEFKSPAVAHWVEFYSSPSKRGFCTQRAGVRRKMNAGETED